MVIFGLGSPRKNFSLQKRLCKIRIIIKKIIEHIINKFNNSSFTIKSVKNMNDDDDYQNSNF